MLSLCFCIIVLFVVIYSSKRTFCGAEDYSNCSADGTFKSLGLFCLAVAVVVVVVVVVVVTVSTLLVLENISEASVVDIPLGRREDFFSLLCSSVAY